MPQPAEPVKSFLAFSDAFVNDPMVVDEATRQRRTAIINLWYAENVIWKAPPGCQQPDPFSVILYPEALK